MAWLNGRLVFRKLRSPEVVSSMRRWYGIDLQLADPSLGNRHLTATFSGEPPESVLEVLRLALGADIERHGDTAVVRMAKGKSSIELMLHPSPSRMPHRHRARSLVLKQCHVGRRTVVLCTGQPCIYGQRSGERRDGGSLLERFLFTVVTSPFARRSTGSPRLISIFHVLLGLLQLTRPVCLDYGAATVGQGSRRPAPGRGGAAGDSRWNQVVLAPVRDRAVTQKASESAPMLQKIGQLDRVVVTGSAAGASPAQSSVALDVVSGKQLSQKGATTLSSAIDGEVPGLWMWEQSPLNLLARYGSIRGASSFGVSYPKVYIDGIEVANSLLVTHLDPESISRMEVIRGPQGAALHGADANPAA